MNPPISVIVPSGNRKDLIEDCLKSVSWADEIIVVDSFSNDGSIEIAKRYATKIIQHEYIFSALQKNWAIPQAKNEWVFILDTDERISKGLRTEIFDTLRTNSSEIVGYRIPRINYFLGKPIMHGGYYPDYQIRLFRRDFGRYDLRKVHAHVNLQGECGTLKSPIIHYAHQSIDQSLKNLLILMTSWEAEEREIKTKNKGLWFQIVFRPIGAFFLRYIKEGGWKDGYRGLVLSYIWSMYVAVTYMKIWEKRLNIPDSWWIENWEYFKEEVI